MKIKDNKIVISNDYEYWAILATIDPLVFSPEYMPDQSKKIYKKLQKPEYRELIEAHKKKYNIK